jgi:TolA-binding protein
MSLSGLGKTNEACLTWAQLKKQFPSAGPVLTRAASESQKNACKG